MVDVADPWARLDHLETYLRDAQVACGYLEPRGGWQPKYRVGLDGAVHALQKPVGGSNAPGEAVVAVRREIAAWLIARELGWARLVAPTVLRTMSPPGGGAESEASLQVIWPEPLTGTAELAAFDHFDVWRAAVFDVAGQNTDRNQNNWMGMGPDIHGALHLKLVDHAHAFEAWPVNSPLVAFVGAGSAPATVRDEITVGLNRWPDELIGLVGDAAEAVRERLSAVVTGSRLADVE
jgi:hypothetical protein